MLYRVSGGILLWIYLLCAQTSVLTYRNDNMRTGQNLTETQLTPTNVKSSTFGKLFSYAVDGKVDAEPLVVSGLSIPGAGASNVVFAATEHDSVYAFDASSGTTYWQVSLLKAGETTSDNRGCGQVTPEIGITATPAIDLTAGPHGTIYVVAMSKDSSGSYHQRLHALDVTTGAEQFSGPVDIAATYPGTGDNSSGGNVVFDPKQYKERTGLLIVNGVIYTSWASHCDAHPYTGWTMTYDELSLAQKGVFNFTPNGNGGAVWGAGGGASADSSGNVYFQIGNGIFDTTLNASGFPNKGDFGNAFVKLAPVITNGVPVLTALDYWTMDNTTSESNADEDLGSGGVLVLPDLVDSQGHVRHLGTGAGKDANVYVFDRDNMGKFDSANNSTLYQELPSGLGGGEFASPAWFNGNLYYGGSGDVIRSFKMTSALLAATPTSTTSASYTFPGSSPSISANGTSNAILWAVQNNSPAVLHAYDANDLVTEFYNSNQAAGNRDQFGSGNKFITPTIANGKVFVGTPNSVAVFGLLVPVITSITPASAGQGATVTVTLAGSNFVSGATVNVSGTGITVGSVTVVSATSITASFSIASGALTGARTVSITTNAGTSGTVTFTVNAAALPSVYIDVPASGASLSGVTAIAGWALENTTAVGPASIASVTLFVDGNQVGTASYGVSRPDVCAAFPGRLSCPDVGWNYNLNVAVLTAGTHTLKAVATDTVGNSSSAQVNFTAVALVPSVYIDSPAANATLSNTSTISGWAIENTGAVGPAAVSSVVVFVDGTQVGSATYGLSRPDVCAAFPGRLGCPNVGWSYNLNVSSFTVGSHTFRVVATDTMNNVGFAQVGFLVAASQPSIYVDSPAANATLSSTATISGWALENTSVVGPAAVSSVAIFVDGAQVGTATYGLSRPDVCAAFAGRLGCPNVGWSYILNVSGLTVGSHSLKVVASDTLTNTALAQVSFLVAAPVPSIYIDSPTTNATLSGTATVSGWAMENRSVIGPAAISSVTILVDGAQVGTATYGFSRGDVCAAYPGRLGCPNVGWVYSLDVTSLAAGPHTLTANATDTSGNTSASQVPFVR
jgi:hypothetical protein